MLIEIAAHHAFENPQKGEEYDDTSFDLQAELARIEDEATASDDPLPPDSDFEDLSEAP